MYLEGGMEQAAMLLEGLLLAAGQDRWRICIPRNLHKQTLIPALTRTGSTRTVCTSTTRSSLSSESAP